MVEGCATEVHPFDAGVWREGGVEFKDDVRDLGESSFEGGVLGDGVFESEVDGVAGDFDYDAGVFERETIGWYKSNPIPRLLQWC